MRLGAILANGSQKQLVSLYRFGQILGRAFQIRDDLLDLTSDFAGLKKQTGNDIYEGKRTQLTFGEALKAGSAKTAFRKEKRGKTKKKLFG